MISILAQKIDKEIIESVTMEELDLSEYLWVWVDFERPSDSEMSLLESYFHFHPLAIEDCMHDMQRPKLDYYEKHSFFVIHSIDRHSLSKLEINIFIAEKLIVTFHKHESHAIHEITSRLPRMKNKDIVSEYFIFHQILDNVVDNYFPIVHEIEDHINEIEDNTKKLSMENLLEQLFDRRGELLKLRQTVHPMRDLLYHILNTHHLEGGDVRREYFVDIHDHLIKVADMIASNREITQDIRDSYVSLNAQQTNRTMQILTIISVIFMPLTFIVGVYGMNFTYMPELDLKYGYLVVWLIMIGLASGMYFWFRKKGWFY
ncbi:magnesium/cobalt transporter CorA [Virgibacillus sp. L01]|uniref:magnesium/cobalt transporter CorA n=1 Tax=Virgibacillus sp. L01 TaxID=3457429 RepID=UPI003FD6A63B